MDRSLDEIISERPRGGGRRPDKRPPPPPRAPRREEYPRDGVRKNRREERANIDTDWVHDRYEDERFERHHRRSPEYDDRHGPPRQDTRAAEAGAKLRVDNLHYDLTEGDVKELFSRIGPIVSARLLYDRMDRSQGTAFVTYADPRDARDAMREFDNANAKGQPIRITLLPTGPADVPPRGRAPGGSLFDRVEQPGRSLFDRIESGPQGGDDGRAFNDNGRGRGRGRRDERSVSPRLPGDRLRAPESIDRYVPGQRSPRSPIRRRGGVPREPGRRPGMRGEGSGRGRGRGRTDDDARPAVGGRRPKKTAEELDAEMADYWGGKPEEASTTNGAAPAENGHSVSAPATTAAPTFGDDDIDMVE